MTRNALTWQETTAPIRFADETWRHVCVLPDGQILAGHLGPSGVPTKVVRLAEAPR